jgi:hypothetical protein
MKEETSFPTFFDDAFTSLLRRVSASFVRSGLYQRGKWAYSADTEMAKSPIGALPTGSKVWGVMPPAYTIADPCPGVRAAREGGSSLG